MSYTKEEFYKSFIDIQKGTGQGTPGIVKVAGGPEITKILDELIEEGLCVVEDTGGSLGHPESNKFYLPSKGYNVWKEKNPMASLECVRYYLAKFHGEKYEGDPFFGYEGDPFFGINETSFQEGGDFYEYYNEWLVRNQEALDEMLNLSDVYPGK